MGIYQSLLASDEFLESFANSRFSAAEKSAILRALRLLDTDERHPSLRVHALEGDRRGTWSVSASRSLRVTFRRLDNGMKALLTCSRHYDE